MKPEPLTEKKIFYIQESFDGSLILVKAVRYEDIKSAVEWLLIEIDKEFSKICKGKDTDTVIFLASLEGRIMGKIERAFWGIENEKKRKN